MIERDRGVGGARGGVQITIDPALAEAVVEARLQGPGDLLRHRLRLEMRRSADRLYRETAGREREAAFQALYHSTFNRLGHVDTLRRSLREFSILRSGLGELVVMCARRAFDEGTDLPAQPPTGNAPRRAILRIRPARFADKSDLQTFLRFTWLQLSDLLDPAFGYEGENPPAQRSPAEARLLVEAYGLLWALYTQVRMRRRGWSSVAGANALAQAQRSLLGPKQADEARTILERVTGAETLTHQELLALAGRSRVAARRGQAHAIEVCALCRFASADVRAVDALSECVQSVLRLEYPDAEDGVCGHCAERLELLAVTGPAGESVRSERTGDVICRT